jgi:uncharacterized protein (TIGR03086 family)
MSENSEQYRRAVQDLSAVVDQVTADKWSAQTPCVEWTARHLVGHLIGGTQMIASVETGQGPAFGTDLAAAAGDDPAGNYAKHRDAALALLTEDNLAKKVQGPMGEMALDQIVGMFLMPDVLIHTWDLARAAGIDLTLDPGLSEQVYDQLLPMDAMIRMPNVFGPKVEPPPGADTQTRLICFVGRQP